MKLNYVLSLMLVGIFIFGCKSGNKSDSADTTDTMSLVDEESTGDVMAMEGGMMGAMHQSMMHLDTMKLTGDPDYDFASMMQMHHRAGIAMGEDVIKNGSDTSIINLAKQIKEGQEKELKELQRYTSNNTPGQSNSAFIQEMETHMQRAKSEMNNSMKMSGNFDKDFATLMAMHHKHGQDMAKAEIKYGKNSEMKSLAQRMANQQEKEQKQLAELKNK